MSTAYTEPNSLFESRDLAAHDPRFLSILKEHGFASRPLPVPLQPRYTKPRRWTSGELDWAFERWNDGETFNVITATLNRNPQDVIFKLLDLCKERGIRFTEAGRNVGAAQWTPKAEACASDLFAAGLPAWKIALIFDVDFEHCEKRLYAARGDYGHKKMNPFAICTDHKRRLNLAIVKAAAPTAKRVFEGYAGEGASTNLYLGALPDASFVAVEENADTAARWAAAIAEPDRVEIEQDTARRALLRRVLDQPEQRFDIVDLDPFVTCADAVAPALELVKDKSLLFVTFGGEYRRCFIGSNRKSLIRRYRVQLPDASNAEALEEMPRFMLGELACQALTQGLLLEPLLVVRYPMIVRAYIQVRKPKSVQALVEGFNASVVRDARGAYFAVQIPKWRRVDPDDPLATRSAELTHAPRSRR